MDLFTQIEPEDYILEESVLPMHPTSKHMIDYCVKLLLKNDITLNPSDTILARTTCIIKMVLMSFFTYQEK